jgi:hypothetical protein
MSSFSRSRLMIDQLVIVHTPNTLLNQLTSHQASVVKQVREQNITDR